MSLSVTETSLTLSGPENPVASLEVDEALIDFTAYLNSLNDLQSGSSYPVSLNGFEEGSEAFNESSEPENPFLSALESVDYELVLSGDLIAYKGRANREVMQLKPSSSSGVITDGGYLDISQNGISKVEIIASGKSISNASSDSIKVEGTKILARLGDLDIPTGGRDSISPAFIIVLYVGSDTRGLVVASNASAGYRQLSYRA